MSRDKSWMKRKNTSSTPKYDRETAKKKKFKAGTKRSVARSSTEKEKKNAKQNKNRPSAATHLPTFRKNKNEAVDDYNQTAAKSIWSTTAAAEAEAARSALEQGNRFLLRLSALCPETAKLCFLCVSMSACRRDRAWRKRRRISLEYGVSRPRNTPYSPKYRFCYLVLAALFFFFFFWMPYYAESDHSWPLIAWLYR